MRRQPRLACLVVLLSGPLLLGQQPRWVDLSVVDHAVSVQEHCAADPLHGGALAWGAKAFVRWDGAAVAALPWNYSQDKQVYFLACDPQRGSFLAEISFSVGSPVTCLVLPDGQVQFLQSNHQDFGLGRTGVGVTFDPVNDTFLAVGGFPNTNGPVGNTFSLQRQPTLGWAPQLAAPQPPARLSPHLATDLARARVVLFGGVDPTGAPLGDTWEWDGATWASIATPLAPSPRMQAGFAYDARRHVCVLHGGDDGVLVLGDTWEWDGQTWARRDAQPNKRKGHHLFYDALRGQVMAWRGSTYTEERDMQVWDGAVWQPLLHPTPLPRSGMAVAADTHRGRVVLFGGVQDNLARGDTWEWNGQRWIERHPLHRPPSRSGAALAYDPVRQRCVLYGGFADDWPYYTPHVDTWEWDGNDWSPVATSLSPGAVWSAQMAYHGASGGVIFLGQSRSSFQLETTWLFDGTGWRDLGPSANTPPWWGPARMAAHPSRGALVLFLADASGSSTWEFRGSWACVDTSSLPGPLLYATFVEDPRSGDLILAAGRSFTNYGPNIGTYSWDGNAWSRFTYDIPPFEHGVGVVDSVRQLPMAIESGMYAFTRTPSVEYWASSTCPGSVGDITLRGAGGLRIADSQAALAVTNVMPGAPVALVSPDGSPWSYIAGCAVPWNFTLLTLLGASASGAVYHPMPIPDDPALRGLALGFVALVLDAGAANGVFATSNYLGLFLGD